MSDFSNKREHGLDIVRAFAVLSVVISHSIPLYISAPPKELFEFFGGFGVELFFVLSGFLIGTIFIRQCDAGLDTGDLKRFWARRWMRTVPAYYMAIIFAFFFYKKFSISYLFFAQWVATGNFNLMVVSWSLAIEEWFYILLPLGTIAFMAINRSKAVLYTALLLIVCGVLYRVQLYLGAEEVRAVARDMRINSLRFDGIAMGVLFAYAQIRFALHEKVLAHKKWMHFLLLVAAAIVGSYFWRDKLGLGYPQWFSYIFQLTYIDIAAVIVVVYFYYLPPKLPRHIHKAIYFFSITSYSNYLWHFYVMLSVRDILGIKGLGAITLYYVVSFCAAAIMYSLTEKPFMALRERMRFSSRPLANAA